MRRASVLSTSSIEFSTGSCRPAAHDILLFWVVARFGREPKLTKHQAREVLKRVAAGEPIREIEPSYNVDRSTISRLKAPYAAEV